MTACGALVQDPSREKVEIGTLVIEVTRRCNMQCDHCLRGDAENLDIRKEYMEDLLAGCSHIGGVTFTGGEPSLNVQAIEDFIEIATREKIEVGYFYIATNGKEIGERMFLVCARLYAMCYDQEMCQVVLSNDEFHTYENTYQGGLLEAFKFFSSKENDDTPVLYGRANTWINEGRYAEYYGDGRQYKACEFEVDGVFISDSEVYLNCEGNVIAGCDWSYESQRDPKNIVCRAGDDLLQSVNRWNEEHEEQ